ncbi:MAG: retropepsin-like aspartic protease [Flavobacterium sp.]
MKKIVLIFLWGFTTIGFSQKIDFNQGSVHPKSYLEEIAFELIFDKIILPVQINDKTYRFLLDTGAPNLISYELYDDIQAQKIKKVVASDANENKDSLKIAVLESVKIGTIEYKNTLSLVSDLKNHPVLKCYNIDGFIGSNLLKNSVLKISLTTNTITLTDNVKRLQPSSKPQKLKLIGDQRAPYITVHFQGNDNKLASESLLIDTGMDGFYDMSTRAFSILSKENIYFKEIAKSKGAADMGLFGVANESEHAMISIHKMKIGNTMFKQVIASTTEDNNSRLGLDMFLHGDGIIDFKNKKFYFEAPQEKIWDKSPPKLNPTFINDTFVVGFVWDEELQKIVSYGDEILKINQQSLSEMNVCEIIAERKNRPKDEAFDLEIKTKEDQIIIITIQP